MQLQLQLLLLIVASHDAMDCSVAVVAALLEIQMRIWIFFFAPKEKKNLLSHFSCSNLAHNALHQC